jgi:hypothetical protein
MLMTGVEMVTQGGDMFLCLVKTSFSKRLCFSVQYQHVVLVKEPDNVKIFLFPGSDNSFFSAIETLLISILFVPFAVSSIKNTVVCIVQ